MAEDAQLSAAQRAKIRRLSQTRELAPDEEGGELNIIPFLDIIVNILIFLLATIAVIFTARIDATPPSNRGAGTRSANSSEALRLTVILVNDGMSIKASGGNVAPGCGGRGAGLAVPNRDGRYDFAALTECATRLKAANPKFSDEKQFYLSANPGVEYQDIVLAIDAMRANATGDELFPDPLFTMLN